MDSELMWTLVIIVFIVGCVLIIHFQGRKKKSNTPVLRDSQKPSDSQQSSLDSEVKPTVSPKTVLSSMPIPSSVPCLSVADQYRKRVNRIFNQIGRGIPNYVEFFNVDHNTDYMHALQEMTVDGLKMWFIFYPNPDYKIFIMIYDVRINQDIIKQKKVMIDKFYGKSGVKFDTTDDYPDYVWDIRGNYDPDIVRDDLVSAAAINHFWRKLLERFL